MRDEWKEIIEREMMEEAERIMEEVNADPLLRDVKAPEELHDKLFAEIREYEKQRMFEQMTEEDKELIRLGKVYKRRRKWSRYLVLVAAVVVVLGVGTVCIGEDENVFSFMSRIFDGEEELVVDSENVEPIVYVEENEALKEIEKTYEFRPVKLEYLPNDTTFCEAFFSTEMQSIHMVYEINDETSIVYIIRPNYRESSLGTVVEDEKIREDIMFINNVEITLTEYNVDESGENRWAAHFEYQDVQYLLRITNTEQEEVEKIINNLGF